MLPNINLPITITILLVHLIYVIENANAEACPSLISTVTRNVTCKFNSITLENCMNPMEGTEAFLSCNEFYEEGTIEANPNRLCKDGKWNRPIPECYPSCGVERSKGSSGPSNEQDVILNNPWHIGIYNGTKSFICEGTLIAVNLVLTAADCISYEYNSTTYLMKDTYVAAGKIHPQYFDKRDKFAQYSKVNKIEVPEQYNGSMGSYAFDLAILVLTNQFYPSQVVQPACINFSNLSYNASYEDNGKATSWIFTQGNTSTSLEVLKEMPVLYISYAVCRAYVQRNWETYYNITFDKICGNYLNNDDTCNGGSGVGLIVKDVVNKRYYIAGIRTIQLRLAGGCNDPDYREYTSICQHTDFLRNHITINKIENCQLPSSPPHGEYVFMNKNFKSTYEPGYPVPPNSTLTLTCNTEYTVASLNNTEFYCTNNGQWTPNLEGCIHISPLRVNPTSFILSYFIVPILGFLAITLILALILLLLLLKQEKTITKELKLAGLYNFQHGDLKKFIQNLGISNQADLLPYNNNFEFPRYKVKLGKRLGSGAFGFVTKAEAYKIISKEEKTMVAVKTVKNPNDNIQLKALISELKILIHLGQHLNVVNLLGACTKNIIERELLVIVEYCPFGNLYEYLLRNRSNYVDQVKSATENIYYSVGLESLENVPIPNDASIKSYGSNTSNNTNKTESRSNYREDYEKNTNPLSTHDLISWSFQVARGMEYLSSRKVVHGDLAARNILLSENNIVKICDFGLAKKLYQNANYKKQNGSRIPLKWMAVESIRDGVLSIKSDVWSYGILLWEFFSLAQAPYPDMEPDEKLYHKLMEGYKMESPLYASNEIYKIMCDCWEINPELRPTFNKLANTVGLMLEDNVRQRYIDLNDSYYGINNERLNKGEKDYLAMLSLNGSYINGNSQKNGASVIIPLSLDNSLKIANEDERNYYGENTNL